MTDKYQEYSGDLIILGKEKHNPGKLHNYWTWSNWNISRDGN